MSELDVTNSNITELVESNRFFIIQAVTEFFFARTQLKLLDRLGHVADALSDYRAELENDEAYGSLAVTANVGSVKLVIGIKSIRVVGNPDAYSLDEHLDLLETALTKGFEALRSANLPEKGGLFERNGTRVTYFRNPRDEQVLNLDRRKFLNPEWLCSFSGPGDKLRNFRLQIGPDQPPEEGVLETLIEISRGNYRHSAKTNSEETDIEETTVSNLAGVIVDIRRVYPAGPKYTVRRLADTESFGNEYALSLFEGEGWTL